MAVQRFAPILALLLAELAPVPLAWAQPPPDAAMSAEARLAMDRVEKHIADLQRRMRITPAQQPQWDALTAIMRQNARHQETLHSSAATARSATDMLRAYAATVQGHAADMQRLVPAFDALYATMTPDQRAAADRVFQQFEAQMEHRRPGLSG